MAVSLLEIMASFLHLGSWQARLALFLLGYDKLVINTFSTTSTIPQWCYIKDIYIHIYKDLTIVTISSHANVHSRVLSWLGFTSIGKHLSRWYMTEQRKHFFFLCIWSRICQLPRSSGQGLVLNDLEKKENSLSRPLSTAFTELATNSGMCAEWLLWHRGRPARGTIIPEQATALYKTLSLPLSLLKNFIFPLF